MATLRGYEPLGGSSRKYRNKRTGKVISRREYDNKRAQKAGFRNRYELEQFRTKLAGSRWANWIYDVKQHTGKLPEWELYADVREVRARRARLARRDLDDKGDPALVAADGPLARILDASGRRPLSGRAVGDS